jgi:EmrB/QacA subfamily drug resistance transporter
VTEATLAPSPAATLNPRRRFLALLAVLGSMLMEVLDGSILNVAIPTIQEDLDAGAASMQWSVAGYLLPFALGMITGGRLGDLFGRRRILLAGTLLFVATSVVCGLAVTPGVLVVGRVLQGLAAALMLPQVMSTIHVMYPPRERGGPVAAAGALFATVSVLAPLLGAVLIELDVMGLGWRTIFLVNVPLGVLTAAAILLAVPESTSRTATRLDLPGVALATLAMTALLVPVVTGPEDGWPVWAVVLLATSPLSFWLFVRQQRRRTVSPLIELSLFRRRSFTAGLAVITLAMGGAVGFFFALTVYLQAGQGLSRLDAALAGAPWGLASAVLGAVTIGLIAPRFGSRVVTVGLAITTVGLLATLGVLLAANGPLSTWSLLVPMLVCGSGMGLAIALVFDFALFDVPVDDAGSASGILNTFQQVAGAVGVATVGTLYFALLPAAEPGIQETTDAFVGALVLPIVMLVLATTASLWIPARGALTRS